MRSPKARATEMVQRHLPAGALWVLYSYGLNYVLQGTYFLLVARVLGAREFGVFGAALAITSIAAPFSGLGSGNVLVQRTATMPSSFRPQLGNAIVLIAISGAGFAVLLVTIANELTPSIRDPILPLVIGELVFARLFDLAVQSFQAHDLLRNGAHLLVAAGALRCVAALGLISVVPQSATTWAYCYAAVAVIAGLTSILLVCRRFGRPMFVGADLRAHWRAGFNFSLGTASKSVYADADKYMLLAMQGPAVAGAFTVAYRVEGFAFSPPQALVYSQNTAMYRAGRQGAEESWLLVRSLLPSSLRLAGLSSLGLLLAAPIAPWVFGGGYGDLTPMLLLLASVPPIQVLHYLLGDALMGLGRQGARSMLQLGAAACNVLLNLLVIPWWSWRGALLATVLSEGLLVLGSLWLFRSERRAAVPKVLTTPAGVGR